MNIFEIIREDHDYQRKLLEHLLQTSGDSEKRKRLFYQLKTELEIHANIEEKHFYKHLINDDSTREMTRHGMAEHHEMDELLDEMTQTNFSSPKWIDLAKKLDEKVRHHLKDEEMEFFQQAGKKLTEKEKVQFAESFKKDRETYRKKNLVVEK